MIQGDPLNTRFPIFIFNPRFVYDVPPPLFLRRWLIFSCLVIGCIFGMVTSNGCAARNAEYDQLMENGDYGQAKQLIRRLLEEYSYRDENPAMPARRAQFYYWLARAHGKLREYDSLKLALSLSVSNDPGFGDARSELLLESALSEFNAGVARYNETVYEEAIEHWNNTLELAESEIPGTGLRAVLLRNLGFAEAGRENTEKAASNFTKASKFGDDQARLVLAEYQTSNSMTLPKLLQRAENLKGLETRAPENEVQDPGPPKPLAPEGKPAMERPAEQAQTESRAAPGEPIDDLTSPRQSWTTRTLTWENISHLPMRGLDRYLPLLNGINDINGDPHVRGSRSNKTGYLIEGISVFNPFSSTAGVSLIPEALDELEVHSGPYGAHLGSWEGGVVASRMKRGGDHLAVTLRVQSDDFAGPGDRFLGTSSFGYRNIVGTAGGPLSVGGLDMKFFIAGEHDFARDRNPMFLSPFRYTLVTDLYGSYPSGTPLPGPVEVLRNHLPNNWLERNTLQGNAAFSVEDVDFTVVGSVSEYANPEGGQWPQALTRIFVQKRNPLNKVTTRFGALNVGVPVGSKTRIKASIGFYDRYQRVYDPDFKHNFRAYPDSLANAQLGYSGFLSRFQPPRNYTAIFGFGLDHPSSPNNSYSKENQFSWSLSGSVTSRVLPEWEIEAGIDASFWTMRYYRINNILWFRTTEEFSSFTSEEDRRVSLTRAGGIKLAGYQYDNPSVEVEVGPDGPMEPSMTSLYIRNVLKYEPATIDVGFRYEALDADLTTVPETVNPVTATPDFQEPPFNPDLNLLNETKLTKSSAFTYFLPRLGISFSLSEKATARIAYGSYVQLQRLSDLHLDHTTLSGLLSPLYRVPYNLGGSAITFMAEPERSEQFEVGLNHHLGQEISAGIVYYHKTLDNQLQLERIANSQGNPIFVALRNGGKGVSTGVEFTLDATMGTRFSANFLYTFSETKGRISNPFDWRYVSDEITPGLYPEFLVPVDYDQTHRGTIIGTLTFGNDDGPILDGTAFSGLVTFRSGQRYTTVRPPMNLGSASPWKIGVRELIDVRSIATTSSENEAVGPAYFNVDLQVRRLFLISSLKVEFVLDILNLFNRKHVLNVFPATGSPNDDAWLLSPFSEPYKAVPLYEEFYRTVNLQNRWAYMGATGNDIYGTPRQIRLGLNVELLAQ